ncbi:MAG: type II toxin-antitoxin system RelE/ParE family toxin, partial [Chloroflexi bacterium]|nr:type II toxin-antitoxin system RelE/ParE family toxin [Chloroflexota bacterium]
YKMYYPMLRVSQHMASFGRAKTLRLAPKGFLRRNHAWLNGREVPKDVKAKLANRLLHLEATRLGDWKRPLVDTLTGHCQGLFEIRTAKARIQYRILGCHGPGTRTPTLLYGFIKRGDKVPDKDCDEALARKARVETNTIGHRVQHDYS